VARLRVDARRLRPPTDTTYTRLVRHLSPEALGAVSGAVQVASDSSAADTTGAPVRVELYAAERTRGAPLRTARPDSSGRFVFKNLPEASYRFRAFLDRRRQHLGRRPARPLPPRRAAGLEPLAR
jgi:hypothetical protein